MTKARPVRGISAGLEFLAEPALILDVSGVIYSSNSAARKALGVAAGGEAENLMGLIKDSADDVGAYLRRASGSTSPHLGSVTVENEGRSERFRSHAARVEVVDADEPLLVLRLIPVRDNQFSILNRRLREIDEQLHQRLKENALLQEALAENTVLVRELQHRVKNNIQQMLSLIKMSASGRRTPEVADVVATASHRLRAMAVTQEALYQNASAQSVSAQSFLENVARGAASGCGALEEQLEVRVEDADMTPEEAHCLALITNELLTNACKYGLAGVDGRASLRFWSSSEGLNLEVRDNGPGLDEGTISRSSGLSLVRSLARQIGGKLDITSAHGTRCSLQFRSELA